MKKIIFPFLGMLILGLSSCKKEADDVIVYGRDIPAIVGYDRSTNKPLLITSGEVLHAPDLRDYLLYYLLEEGDVILAYFYLNQSRQPADNKYRTVTFFDYWKLGVTSPTEEEEVDADDFIPVEYMTLYDFIIYDRIYVLFAGFIHTSYYRDFDYEMTYDAGETDDEIPVLSVRAKPRGQEYKTLAEYRCPYAFDMYEYLMSLEKDAENKVRFDIRYGMGKDGDGNEVWEYWTGIEITLE